MNYAQMVTGMTAETVNFVIRTVRPVTQAAQHGARPATMASGSMMTICVSHAMLLAPHVRTAILTAVIHAGLILH